MKLEGQRWRTLLSTVRLGPDEYRVIRPLKPLSHAPMHEGYLGMQMTVDKTTARTLAMAWALAARSPRTIVYLPMRHSDRRCSLFGTGEERLLDLVLLHHSLGFPASRWKAVRAKLGAGRPHTVVSQGLPEVEYVVEHDDRDVLRHDIAADTLFLVGSRKAFEYWGEPLRELVEDCPRHMHEEPGTHCCAEVTVDGMRQWLHVEYCLEHRVR
ncbi:hypothetical protein FKR81_40030 [Lentzea tibetensis]|uniref:Uncharacterized protein n=1 Tax=Lentzea tibetensis TaxID=2591470 RepID=A0A563EGD9_9PSEU|nr:hypothetical protein [Lentzea tibetensis]TWP45151.1 hypothetical protein FKR81_40030 [Lentzea tibetensis]